MEQDTLTRNDNRASISPKKFILMCGLPGAGKTTTAHRIRQAINDTIVISRDYHRLPYRGNGCVDQFSNWQATIVDRIFYARAEELLSNYTTIILDATFRECVKRQVAIDLAHMHGCEFFIIECVCSYPVLLHRLQRQMLWGEKKLIQPPQKVLQYYRKNMQVPKNVLSWASFIRLDTEKNKVILKSIQDQSCQFAKFLVEILEQPFDPSSLEYYCATFSLESLPAQEISQLNLRE